MNWLKRSFPTWSSLPIKRIVCDSIYILLDLIYGTKWRMQQLNHLNNLFSANRANLPWTKRYQATFLKLAFNPHVMCELTVWVKIFFGKSCELNLSMTQTSQKVECKHNYIFLNLFKLFCLCLLLLLLGELKMFRHYCF